MSIEIAENALRTGNCLALNYDDFARIVEVHAAGYTKDGHGVIRAWQTNGGSRSGEEVGWKLFRVDRFQSSTISTAKSLAPRDGFKRGDKAMAQIVAEL